jgi:hypothetical protein
MKIKSIAYLLIALAFTACNKSTMPVITMPVDNMAAFKGVFASSAHPTSGTASINKEKTILSLTNFKSDPGPDLDIYFASNLANVNAEFINLGDIKGLNGNYDYSLPTNVDFTKYKYVIVWCKAFNVNFGYATLAP